MLALIFLDNGAMTYVSLPFDIWQVLSRCYLAEFQLWVGSFRYVSKCLSWWTLLNILLWSFCVYVTYARSKCSHNWKSRWLWLRPSDGLSWCRLSAAFDNSEVKPHLSRLNYLTLHSLHASSCSPSSSQYPFVLQTYILPFLFHSVMASSVFSSTLQSITTAKLSEISKKRGVCESQKAALIKKTALEQDNLRRLRVLFHVSATRLALSGVLCSWWGGRSTIRCTTCKTTENIAADDTAVNVRHANCAAATSN